MTQDYVQAHMWFNLAAAGSPPGEDRDRAAKNRGRVAKLMTPAQIAEAQRRANAVIEPVQTPPRLIPAHGVRRLRHGTGGGKRDHTCERSCSFRATRNSRRPRPSVKRPGVLAAILSDVYEQYYDDEELRAERVFQRPAMNRDSPGKRSRTRPAFAHRP